MRKIYIFKLAFLTFFINACQQNPNSTNSGVAPTAVTVSEDQAPFGDLVSEFESMDRVIWQKPDIVLQKLGNIEGKTIADIGAGSGYFSFRMVNKAEKVIAIDIDKRFISFMDSISTQLPPVVESHFETRLATPTDPKLYTAEVDAVIVVNTYSYLTNRVTYLKTLINGMKHDAKILIIDYKKKNTAIGPPIEERVAMDEVEKELLQAGFKNINTDDTSLDYQYIVTAMR
jgi:cyclopropane fatty-acyl-phospholipid synthase-like methyltransferase